MIHVATCPSAFAAKHLLSKLLQNLLTTVIVVYGLFLLIDCKVHGPRALGCTSTNPHT